jgi:2-polyprenyl-6-methoxyphenol hydroxylase-like FAD-dependent oxidoreductase
VSISGADVVVVGGGVGGLTAALLLADVGAQVTVLERVDDPGDLGAGILLQPNGLAVLMALGLGDALEQAGHVPRRPALRDDRGAVVAELSPPDSGDPWDRLLAMRRSRLHGILLAAVAGRSTIATRFGAQVSTADADGTVELRWRDRISTITADLVVGADGVGSAVRSSGSFGARTRETGGRYVRGLVDGADLGLEGEHWTRLGVFGGVAVDGRTTYFYASATARAIVGAIMARDLDGVRDAWSAVLPAAGPVLRRVADFTSLVITDVVRVDCGRWVDGRVVLLGDAAHAMAPTLGQGANSAIVDAAVLASELDGPTSMPDGLRRYAARRRGAVRRVQNNADRIAVVSGLRQPWLRVARDAALRALAGRPGAAATLARAVHQERPDVLHATVSARRPRAGAS